jgi:hypothetical protein
VTMACAMPGRNAGRQRQAGERPARSCTRLNAGNRSAYEGAHHRASGVGRSVGLADAGQSDALELEPEQPAQQLRLEIAWSNATIDEKDDSTSRRPSRGHKGGEAPRDSAAPGALPRWGRRGGVAQRAGARARFINARLPLAMYFRHGSTPRNRGRRPAARKSQSDQSECIAPGWPSPLASAAPVAHKRRRSEATTCVREQLCRP